MTKMFVANLTHQVQDFHYRVPEANSIRKQVIPIFSQVQLSGDLNTPTIDGIIEQHGKYGFVSVDEIDRTKPFAGLCYSLDRPVPRVKIELGVHHNRSVLEDKGREMRKEMAVAVNNSLEDQAPEGSLLKSLEMSVVEEKSGDLNDHAPIAEGVRVSREAGQPAAPPRGGRGSRAKAA